MKTVVTHSGNFHTDDVFAVATLQLLLGVDQVQIVRTRENTVIENGDYVVDVGEVYDPEAHRFDHHQNNGPVRENGMPYAAFGLVWKEYGAHICGSARVSEMIEEQLCVPVDAGDNGVHLYDLKNPNLRPYELFRIIGSFRPIESTNEAFDTAFLTAVDFARSHIQRVIAHGLESERIEQKVRELYDSAEDKRVLVLDGSISENYFVTYPDVVATVYPSVDNDRGEVWKVAIIPKAIDSFEKRVEFPASWLGLRNSELANVSVIPDAIFCHKVNFRFVAKSKESALKATEFLK